MDSVVPAEITAELTQILSNLVLGDNEIRSNAEKAVNERLAHTPELYLLALAQFAITADTEVMRSFSLVLLRRLLFRPSPSPPQPPTHPPAPKLTLYDHLSSNTLTTLENLLLHSLSNELSPLVRKKTVDTACDLANESMKRGRPWHALQAQVFGMAQAHSSGSGAEGSGEGGGREVKLRESAFWVFAGCPNLLLDLQVDSVVGVLRGGLGDGESVEVRHAALQASVTYLTSADTLQLSQSSPTLLPSMLSTLPELARNLSTQKNIVHLTNFLSTLTPLCSTHPTLFKPHLQLLLSFLPSIVMPHFDSGKTPTVHRPYSAFEFPPTNQVGDGGEEDEDEERKTLRLTAMEFIVSLSEARPGMVKGAPGWVENGVRACLEGMSEVEEDEGWVGEDPSTGSNEDSPAALYEQSLDRLACALGGKAVLPPAFQYIPSMLLSYEWRSRHAGLMAIAAIAEGTGKVMKNELGKIVEMVVPMFRDSHPRVRYAACQCVGQLCTDLEEVIQAEYHQQLFNVLIPALEDAEPRVHAHAAAALINFCEGVVRETLLPYLDPIVERLLKLLNPPNGEVRRYVQEQAITTLAMVADASEATFAKHYPTIMPLLLNVLRNADGPEYRKLRVKAMECAGLIAIAVGREVFRPDSGTLIELLIRIQKSPIDPQDTQLGHYLIATWAKVCQALGPEFEPYLPVVMPTLLATASAKADISVYDEDAEEERDGWETISMDGQTLGIRTSAIEEKCQAFETLVIYCSTLGAKFAPHLAQTLEVTLPSLKFYFHDGVREACAILIPMLLVCGKNSNTLTPQMLSATFTQLITCINSEHDISFLASLYKCFTDSLRVIGGAQSLTPEFQQGIITATNRQLQQMADKRRTRANRANNGEYEVDKEEMALLEEIEEFALEDMDKMLAEMDANHPLRIAISGVRDLGFNTWDSEEEGDEEG